MTEIKDMRRQGDVLLVARGEAPADAKPVEREGGRIVLMHGEVTGHSHAVLERDAVLVETGTADAVERWLKVGASGAVLVHEEHSAHELLPNTDYEQWQQFEYTPQEIQRVAD
mgnify:CR=1 FL=1